MVYTEDIINILRSLPKDLEFAEGIANPHSYRGSYDNLSVEPSYKAQTADEMLNLLESSLGKTYTGYKGGDFAMLGDEEIFLAYEGCTGSKIEGVKITPDGLELLLNNNY